jgi:ketosteroid isomerase-like protein
MSQENVELVKAMCSAFIAGDFALALGGLDEDVVWHGTVGGLEQSRTARGRQQVAEAFQENLGEWESHSLQAQRFIDAGDRVIVFWHEKGRGRSSGVEVATDTAVIYTVRGDRVVDVQGYMDRSAAVKSAGLAE